MRYIYIMLDGTSRIFSIVHNASIQRRECNISLIRQSIQIVEHEAVNQLDRHGTIPLQACSILVNVQEVPLEMS